jgi:hypothetical protein
MEGAVVAAPFSMPEAWLIAAQLCLVVIVG